MRDGIREIIAGVSLIALVVAIVLVIGTAGALEQDNITMFSAIKRLVALLIVIVICAMGIVKTEDEEDIYDRL